MFRIIRNRVLENDDDDDKLSLLDIVTKEFQY